MTLDANKIKFSNMEIYNSGNDMIFNATQNINLNSSGSGIIQANNETIDMENNLIYNCGAISSLSGTNLTVESLGTGKIILKTPNTQITPIMQIDETGQTFLNHIPTCTTSTTTTDEICRWNNFTTNTSFTPSISGNTIGSPVYSNQSGSYTMVGNLIFFRCAFVVTALTGLTLSDDIRISIPIAVDYTTINMPQSLCISHYTGFNTTAIDYSITIGNTGSSVIGSSINYAKIYFRSSNNSSGMSTLKLSDLTLPATIRYSGCYYVF